jgi:hypothetical protein
MNSLKMSDKELLRAPCGVSNGQEFKKITMEICMRYDNCPIPIEPKICYQNQGRKFDGTLKRR